MKLEKDSLEARIVRFLQEIYPVTMKDIRREFREPAGRIDIALKRLQMAGIIEIERLPDTTYIRLIKAVGSVGSRPLNRRAIKHERSKKRAEYDGEDNSVMYG